MQSRSSPSLVLLALVVCAVVSPQAQQSVGLRKIGELELPIVGLSATVDGARPAIPKNVAAGVRILIDGGGTALAPGAAARLLGTFSIQGELSGPSLGETITVQQTITASSTAPDLILPLPAMAISGEHALSNLRIVNANGPLLDLNPGSVPIDVVEQVLITSVRSRPLTLQEIKDKGIVLDSDDYRGFEFTLGVLLESKPVNLAFPVVFDRAGVALPIPQSQPQLTIDSVQVPLPSPRITPMLLTVPKLGPGTTIDFDEEDIRIPSLLVIPGEVGFLKQFFSAQLFVANGTPATANLIVRDVTGTLALLKGPDSILHTPDDPFTPAETVNGVQPLTMAIAAVGPDALPGTSDDVSSLRPGEQGQAEFLIRGDHEGFHTLEFDIAGILDGLPTGPIEVSGKAIGGVLVRNAAFDVSFTLPTVVRAGEPFKLYATVNNIGEGIANDVTMTIDAASLSGLRLIGDGLKQIDTIMPGDAQTLVFDFEAGRTGQVVATYLRFEGEGATGDIRFKVGVGERNVPLSPDTLVLPAQAEELPPGVLASAMRVLGQAWSIANTPPNVLPAGVARISKQVVTTKALALAEAGLRIKLGQPAADAVRDLLPDFYGLPAVASATAGPAPVDRGFDQLLRTTDAGRNFNRAIGAALAPTASPNASAFEGAYAEVAASGRDFVSFSIANGASGAGVGVTLTDNAGRVSRDTGSDADPRPAVTSAVIAPLGAPASAPLFGLIAAPAAGPYRLELTGRDGGPVDLTATYPRGDGSFTRVSALGVNVPAGAKASLAIDPARASPSVEVDHDADGTIDATVPLTVDVVTATGPHFLSATMVGPETFESAGPFGFNVALLFDRVVNAEIAGDRLRYAIPDNEFVSARRQLSGRLVLGALAQPEGPYIPTSVTVSGITDLRGVGVGAETRPMQSLLRDPGAVISGRVINGDGQLASGARVIYRANPDWKDCQAQDTAGFSAVRTDASGRYQFRYVYRDRCGWPWRIQAVDDVTGAERSVHGNVRTDGERITADIALLGRGGVTGIVRNFSGDPVAEAQVIAISTLESRVGGSALTDGDGRYTITGITVGPATVKAAKGASAGTATAQIARAGTLASADVTLNSGTVSVSGKVVAVERGATTPAAGAVVVFAGADPLGGGQRDAGVAIAEADGRYAFTAMPAGLYSVRAQLASGETQQISGIASPGDVHEDRDISIQVTRNATVSGVVRYADGTAVAHPIVTLSSRGVAGEADGTFTVEHVMVSEHPQTIRAHAPDGLREGQSTVLVNQSGQHVTGVVVTLNGIGTLDLIVIDSLGPPVRNQIVQIARTGQHISPTDCTAFHLAPTDEFGKVQFAGLHVGAVRVVSIRATANGVDIATLDSTIPYEGALVSGVLRFGGGGAIRGRVTDDLGGPVFGADIEVYSKLYNSGLCRLVAGVSHRVRTDLDGNYRVTGVPVGTVKVKASQPFFPTPIGASGVLLRDGDELTLDLQLVNTIAGELSGTVFLPDGITPAGAGVAVSAIGALPEVLVTTNDQGRYKFAKIFPAGTYQVTVRDPVSGGVARNSVVLRTGEDAQHDFRLKGRGEVRIDVVDGAGTPVSNALVTLTETEFPNETFEAVVEPSNEGVVTFDRVHEGRFSVTASDVFARGGRVAGEVPGPNTSVSVTVRMTVTGTVTGRFLMPDGTTPIPFGAIRLIANNKVIGQSTTSAGEDLGEFTFDYVPAGTVRLEALDPATGRSGVAVGQITTEGQQLALDVRAQGLGTATGVVTSNGAPQPGAHVEVSSGTFRAQATADGNGVYQVPGVPEGTVTVQADLEGALQGVATGTLIGDGTTATIDVALQASGTVAGIVTRSDGVTPAPPSIVTIRISNTAFTTTTDAAGAYRFDVIPAGSRTITADVIGSIDTGSATAAVAGAQTTDVPIRLIGVGGIAGHAQDANGVPVGGTVTITGTGGTSYSLMLTVNPDGTFTAPQVLAGSFSAKVQHTGGGITLFGTAQGVVAPDGVADIVVALQPTGEVRGSVRRSDGVTPAIGADVTLTVGFGVMASGQVLSNGTFSFTGLPLATYGVSVHDPTTDGYARHANLVLAENGDIQDTGALTLDDTVVTLQSITPADGATAVLRTVPIVLTFTDALGGTGGVNVKHGTTAIGAGRSLSGDGRTLTLTGTWPDSAEITVEVTTGVTDTFGRHPAVATTSRFHTVDTTAPSVASIAPLNDAYQVPDTTTIVVTFSEPIVNATVDGLIVLTGPGGIAAGATAHGSPNVVTFTPGTPLADNGVFTVTVNGAVDVTGNQQGTPFVSTFATTDTVPPVLAITAPPLSTWINDTTPAIVVSRADATSRIDVNSGTLTIDGTPVAAAKSSGSMSFSVSSAAPLAEGTHTIEATSADRAGNSSTVSGAFMLDATPPSPAGITNLDNGAVITGPISVAATATDAASGVARIELRRDGQTVLNLLPPAFTDTWSGASTADGPHVLTVRAVDVAGNIGAEGAPVNVIVDQNPLTVTITEPVANFRTRQPFTATATVSEPVQRVEFTLGGVTSTDSTAPYSATLPVDPLPEGDATLTVQAFGLIGEVATATRTIVIDRSSPVARWPFDEGSGTTTADASGNGHHGALVNGAAWAAIGYAGRSIAFDGVDAAVTVANSADLDATAALTMAAWVSPSAIGTVQTVIQKAGAAYAMSIGPDGRAEAVIYPGGSPAVVQSASPIALNLWTHVAATFDGAQLRLFVDGVEVATTSATGVLPATDGAIWLGRSEVATAFSGRLDEIRIYDRALSAVEVQALAALQISGVMMGGGFRVNWIAQPGGPIWSVGQNNSGSMGSGSGGNHDRPGPVANLTDVAALAGRSTHAFAITKSGALYAWGGNSTGTGFGVLGDGTTTARLAPVVIPLDNVIQIATGIRHAVALLANGEAWAWGDSSFGEFGDGTTTGSLVPKKVMSGVRAVGAGDFHTLFVKTDGTVWATGANHRGQLGRGLASTQAQFTAAPMIGVTTAVSATGSGSVTIVTLSNGTLMAAGEARQVGDGTFIERPQAVPVPVTGLTDVIAIETGSNHVLALKADRTVWAWGVGNSGQLGHGGTGERFAPVQVPGLADIIHIGAGDASSFAASASGVVYAWGDNGFTGITLLGDGGDLSRVSPVPISAENYEWKVATPRFNPYGTFVSNFDRSVTVTDITAGATIHYTLDGSIPTEADPAIASGGSILIDATRTLSAKAFKDGMPPSNVQSDLYRQEVGLPAVTPNSSLGFTTPQTVTVTTVTPGAALHYTIGTAASPPPDPTEASALYTAPFVVSTQSVIKVRGFKVGWTPSSVRQVTVSFNYGTLAAPVIAPGTGTYINSVTPVITAEPIATIRFSLTGGVSVNSPVYTGTLDPIVKTATTLRARAFHVDYTQSAEVSATYTIQAPPPTLSVPSGTYAPGTAVLISGEAGTTIRVTIDGSDPTSTSAPVPSGTTMFAGNFTLKARAFRLNTTDSAIASETYALTAAIGPGTVSAGDNFLVMATPYGRVLAWGWGGSGQIGDGGNSHRSVPTLVQNLTGVIAVGTGGAHSTAVTLDGRVFAWGFNGNGELGDGTTTSKNRPVLVTGVSNVVAIAAGWNHNLALTADGQVFSWGRNANGQLGNGTTTNATTPIAVNGLPPIAAIAAGLSHSLALTTDGQVYGWGANFNGQLGDGTSTPRLTPTLLPVTNVDGVFAPRSSTRSFVRLVNGKVLATGSGQDGSLGFGNTSTRFTFGELTHSPYAMFAAGELTTGGLRLDGSGLIGWGTNSLGQIGTGAFVSSQLTPTASLAPADVSTFRMDTTSIAVTPAGEVWIWGAGTLGQWGDGTLGTSRHTPQLAFTVAEPWAPAAPVFSVAPGTYSNAVTLVVSTTMPGASIRYTLDGSTPDDSSLEVPAIGEILINQSLTVRARVFAPGRAPSAITAGAYVIQP